MKRRIWIFIATTFTLTGALSLAIYQMGGAGGPAYTALAALVMFIPALGSLLTRLLTKEGFGEMRLRPRFRGNLSKYLIAWLAPLLMTLFGCLVFFLVFPANFDPAMGAMTSAYAAQGMELPGAGAILMQSVLSALIMGPLINLIPALGEELGWRGYLLPKLCEVTSKGRAVVLSGVIWGLWHAPLIAMGHNYGVAYPGAPWLGILTMTVLCVFLGAFLSWLALSTGSAIPCALAHGAVNAVFGLGILFVKGEVNPLLGPMGLTWIGGAGVILTGLVCLVRIKRAEQA